MLHQVQAEALYSATYVKTYLDSVENLPDDVQRYLSRIREIDVQYRAYLRDVDNQYEAWSNCSSSELESTNTTKRTRAMTRIQQSLIAAQELGDEKLQIVTQLQELIDQKTRQLDNDFKSLDFSDYAKEEPIMEVKEHHPTRVISPPLLSPLAQVNANVPLFKDVTSPVIVPSNVLVVTSTALNSLERSSSANNNANNSNGERSSKRARRTRTDTLTTGANLSGNVIDINTSDSNLNLEVTNSSKSAIVGSSSSSGIGGASGSGSQSTSQSAQKKNSSTGGTSGGKKKKRKTRGGQTVAQTAAREETPPHEEPIDPDEPTYCLCDQISFGEMILCDNDLCPIEWFHFSCVSLLTKPKGKWFCPNCRGDRPNLMKPKAQFLKELERYNKEKEEKT